MSTAEALKMAIEFIEDTVVLTDSQNKKTQETLLLCKSALSELENSEPVAYIHKHYSNEDKDALDWHKREHPQFKMIPLYTTPPQPKTVKDALEKAASICDEHADDPVYCGDAIRALIDKE